MLTEEIGPGEIFHRVLRFDCSRGYLGIDMLVHVEIETGLDREWLMLEEIFLGSWTNS